MAPPWLWDVPVPVPAPCPGDGMEISHPCQAGMLQLSWQRGRPCELEPTAHPCEGWGVFRPGGAPQTPLPQPKTATNPLLPKLTPHPSFSQKTLLKTAHFPWGKKPPWGEKMCPEPLWGAQGRVGDANRGSWQVPVPQTEIPWLGLAVSCSLGDAHRAPSTGTNVLGAGMELEVQPALLSLLPKVPGLSHKVTSPSSHQPGPADPPLAAQAGIFPTSGQFLVSVSSCSFPLGSLD